MSPLGGSGWLDTLTGGLAATLDEHGFLVEPGDVRRCTPDDHYAQVFTALALQVRPWHGDWRRPLEAWASLPPARRGHEPFNRLGLLILQQRLQRSAAPADDQHRVRRALEGCPLRRAYPSNNWTLLAATVRLLEAPTLRAERRRAHRLARLAEGWMTRAGGFVDFPAVPGHHPATPAAYHFKALLCLWLAACRVDDPRIHRLLARAMGWLGLVGTRAGYCGGLGRSNHALFGDACLLAVLQGVRWAGEKRGCGDAEHWRRLSEAIEERLDGQRREDGLFWLTPAGAEDVAGGWDRYMHLSVYNAWMAGLLSVVANRDPMLTAGRPPGRGQVLGMGNGEGGDSVWVDEQAGLVRVEGRDWSVGVSLHGQAVQGYSRSEGDLRASAGLPFHVEVEGEAVLAPPARQSASQWRARPWQAGWLLLVASGEIVYGPLQFERAGWSRRAEGLAWWGEGVPRALWATGAGGGWARLRDAIDWRVLGGALQRRRGIKPAGLSGHRWRLEMDWHGPSRRLRARWTLFGCPGSAARLLNPGGWAILQPASPPATPLSDVIGSAPSSLGPLSAGAGGPECPWPDEEQVFEATVRLANR